MSRQVLAISIMLYTTLTTVVPPTKARVSSKVGYSGNHYNVRSATGINDIIIWVSIGMALTIAVLISLALCYIAKEKCKKQEYYITA